MGFILIAIVLIAGAIILFKKCIEKNNTFTLGFVECMCATICSLAALVLITLGIMGFCIGESEYNLLETDDLVGVKQGESTYVFLDEENQAYYLTDDRIKVINKNGIEENTHCTSVIGDYDKSYVQKYKIDYKMNFWTFNLMNGSEYKIYIPANMASE